MRRLEIGLGYIIFQLNTNHTYNMNNITDDDDGDALELGNRTWNRTMQIANKTGFREGVEKGSEAVLQKDFDRGYEDGFKIAFLVGKYKGFAACDLKGTEHPLEINNILERGSKGICYICELELSGEDFKDDSEIIINKHKKHVSKIMDSLYSYFHPLLKDQGIDISDLKYE